MCSENNVNRANNESDFSAHLTIDEILDFVSMTAVTPEAVALATRVYGHMNQCAACSRLVRAFLLIDEELERLGAAGLLPEEAESIAEAASEENAKSLSEKIVKSRNGKEIED